MKQLTMHSTALTSTGERVTEQRLILLDLIRKREGHLDADELYRLARQKAPRLSLSTVYRNLQLFKKLGLVEQCRFDEPHLHYEASADDEHYHVVCRNCGEVVEFKYPDIGRLQRRVSDTTGFEVTKVAVQMEGYCKNCRADGDS